MDRKHNTTYICIGFCHCCLFVLEVVVLFLARNKQQRDSEHTLHTIGPKEN